ncbi:MAG: helix-hairpin-helix domain-containing protein [Acetatifactor sp.]|nr:helix-hairpin-helix domain-containing protein [Acetatifactor sp.]
MGKWNKIKKCKGQRDALWLTGKSAVVLFACVFFAWMAAGCQSDQALTLQVDESGQMTGAEGNPKAEVQEKGNEGSDGMKRAGEGEATPLPVLIVHVCGAVRDPGVKRLPAGSRAADALEMAGGFTEAADQSYVNLAAFVEDGQQLYFPEKGEKPREGTTEGGPVDLNSADETALQSIPGIGESRAKAILKYRKEHGRFSEVEELLQVPGIGDALYQQIQDLVTVSR